MSPFVLRTCHLEMFFSYRGADPQAADMDGKTPLQYAIDFGTIDDDEILLLLEDPIR